MRQKGMIIIVTVIAATLAGCQQKTQTDPAELSRSATDARRAELNEQLARRYENPEAHYELGKIFHQEGNLLRAEQHYNVAMGFDPVHRRAQAAMVRLLKDRQESQRAQITADLYINQAAASPDALMALGRSFQREKLDDLALTSYQRAMALAPNTASIHKQLGYFYLAKNDQVRAEGYFRRSFEIDPNQPDVAAELGRMGVQVTIPPRKATGFLGPLRDAVSGDPDDDPTIK
ncbi:MAG: hypothetical protein GXY41_11520 [Phycisphaerae bacterium]|nr:hypothetical protein [Phycisphaerae bacterium]